MKITGYLGILTLSMGIFQISCAGDSQSDAWRVLARMKATDYFIDPLQINLAEAAARGNVAKISGLLKQGADVNATGRDGMRPLFWAMGKNSLKGFELLLQNGANPNVTVEGLIKGERPPSVMELAAIAVTPEYLLLALKHGGNPNYPVGYGNCTIINEAILNNRTENARVLIENGADINHQDSSGSTPIMTAAGIGNFDMVYLFLEKGANPKLKDKWGDDLASMMQLFGDRGIKPDSAQYQWYLKVVAEMKKRGLIK